jgi:RsiW-degrading membrane proteinase PrsW (M82 family)
MFLDLITKYPFILAFLLGLIPALIWLWFWLKEDLHPEPAKMVTLSFLGGMLAVVVVLPIQQFIYPYIIGKDTILFTVFAGLEELFKFAFVYFIALRNRIIDDEPVDNIIYLVISALGFVALENTLFLLDPIRNGDILKTIITGNMRFIGASLIHIISSGTIGIFIGLSFYKNLFQKKIYLIAGFILAVVLHTSFNLLIINVPEGKILLIFGIVWIGIITLLLLFEKVKHLKTN